MPHFMPQIDSDLSFFWKLFSMLNIFILKKTPFYTGQFVYAVAIPAISHHHFNNLLNLRKNETIFITWNVKTKEIK